MNPIPMLRELLAADPFRPFVVCLTDGRKLRVDHPDFLLITPSGRLVWEGRTENEFAMAMPLHVTGIKHAPRRRRGRAA
jgi:hypothetical protein